MVSQVTLNDLHDNNYGLFAVLAFLGYEHLITFDTEVALFWQKRFSGASLLFFVNRYLTIAWAIATAASPYYSSAERFVLPHAVQLSSFLYFPWAVFSALRVYALGRIWSLAAIVFVLSMMPNITKFAATFCIMLTTGLPDHSPDCKTVQGPITKQLANTLIQFEETRPTFTVQRPPVTIVTRTSLIAAELIVLVVSWITTYRRGTFRGKSGEKHTVAHVVLLNGTTYFLAMLFLNCLQLGFTLAAVGPTRKVLNVSEVTTFSEPITSVLITRFLCDLQRANQRDVVNLDSTGPVSSHSSSEMIISPHTMRFRSMFDSFGSVLVREGDESAHDDTEYEATQ
ncbi:hypothetical protein GSI_12504 [Ganoderma sinense ZZ0214-1]|uniref:DUF6533 domain-containing protein n=1 Tax=Ganoderma sinense ZZ0214-1 TaxID=1077348 RepID=A0A2G8RSY8_9APHY|nr:hypothetical protein GSI_12504 [Ganoderma sinense ZZ0214-1]